MRHKLISSSLDVILDIFMNISNYRMGDGSISIESWERLQKKSERALDIHKINIIKYQSTFVAT